MRSKNWVLLGYLDLPELNKPGWIPRPTTDLRGWYLRSVKEGTVVHDRDRANTVMSGDGVKNMEGIPDLLLCPVSGFSDILDLSITCPISLWGTRTLTHSCIALYHYSYEVLFTIFKSMIYLALRANRTSIIPQALMRRNHCLPASGYRDKTTSNSCERPDHRLSYRRKANREESQQFQPCCTGVSTVHSSRALRTNKESFRLHVGNVRRCILKASPHWILRKMAPVSLKLRI